MICKKWMRRQDSNLRSLGYEPNGDDQTPPLRYYLELHPRIELSSAAYKAAASPFMLVERLLKNCLGCSTGLEPAFRVAPALTTAAPHGY